jgi:tetratricopeptide (TPR) repeat protein
MPPLERALSLNRDNDLAEFALARAYTETGRLAEAETMCSRVVERRPESLDGHYLLTLIYLGLGKGNAAAAQLEKLAGLDPELAKELLIQLMDTDSAD